MHFFFPDSRINLDLTTDKTLKDARFDRHFVRDMVWSRHQLEELAERRFQAARDRCCEHGDVVQTSGAPFNEMFREVRLFVNTFRLYFFFIFVSSANAGYLSCLICLKMGMWSYVPLKHCKCLRPCICKD
jgi:hypothetical protein